MHFLQLFSHCETLSFEPYSKGISIEWEKMPFLLLTRVRKHHGDQTSLWELSVLLLSKAAATLENWNLRLSEITEELILGPFLSVIHRLYSFSSSVVNAELL